MMTRTVNLPKLCVITRACQSTKSAKSVCDDKNCQSTKSVHMWAVKSAMKSYHMNSVEPAMLQPTYKKFSQVFLCGDKNCQSTKKHSYEEC